MKFPILEGMLPKKALASKPSKPIKKPLDVVPQFEAAIHQGKASNQVHISNQTIKRPTEMLLTNKQLREKLAAAEAKAASLETRLKASTAAAQSKPAPQAIAKPGLKPAPAVKVSRRTALELIQLPKELRDGMDRTAAYLRTEGAAIREEIEAAYEAADVASRAGLRSAFPHTLKPRIIR